MLRDVSNIMTESCTVASLTNDFLSNRIGTRAGCIPYFILNRKLYFVFGEDDSKEYTDFGGGVKTSDESVIRASLREFIEETLGVFGFIYENEVQDYLCCYDDKLFILFLPIESNNICEQIALFYDRLHTVKSSEIKNFLLIEESELSSLLQSNNQSNFTKFYEKTYSLLKCFDLTSLVQSTQTGLVNLNFPDKLSLSGTITRF